MIREANSRDISIINEIGKVIKDNFKEAYNIEDALTKEYVHIYIYEDEDIIKGFLHIENHFEVTDIINIAVNKSYQDNFIGTKLLTYLIENTSAERIMLEVNEKNLKAIHLYEKMGFKKIHIRPAYYGEDDAIIMERKLV